MLRKLTDEQRIVFRQFGLVPLRSTERHELYAYAASGKKTEAQKILGEFKELASVLKNTKLSESLGLQLRAEIFDIFNHANFGQPGPIAQVSGS